jgi:signal transduction histidine kinase
MSSSSRVFSTSTQVAFNSFLLLLVILSFSAIFIYRVSESVFIRNYSVEMRRIFLDSPAGRGVRQGMGRMSIGRGGAEFYVSINGIVFQNPANLSSAPNVDGYVRTRIDGVSYLFFGFSNGSDKVLLGAQMEDLDFFLQSLSTTLLLSILVGAVLSIISGIVLGRRVARPLQETSKLLKEITLDDLSKRLVTNPKTSELAEMKSALNLALDRIEDGYRRQEQFSSDIAHEIRSPLTSILGFSRMIQRWGAKDPEVLMEAVKSIYETAGKMLTVTEGLLFLSRPIVRANIEEFNLNELVREVCQDIPAVSGSEINAIIPDITVKSDPALLKIALKILLENAVKYGEGRPVEVVWKEGKLSVRDWGRGIKNTDLERIFDRFYRGDTSRSGEGHGLGLSIVSKICIALGLEITAENSVEGGAIFSLEGFG